MAKLSFPPTIFADAPAPEPSTGASDWRCLKCGKLLGIRRGARLHIRMQGHDYDVNLPAEAICRGCGAHNQT